LTLFILYDIVVSSKPFKDPKEKAMDTEMVQIPRKALEKIEWINVACGEGFLSICPACGREKEMQKGHKDDCPIGIALKNTNIQQKTMELDGDKFVTVIQKEGRMCKGCYFLRNDGICGIPRGKSVPNLVYYGCEACHYTDRKNRIWVKVTPPSDKPIIEQGIMKFKGVKFVTQIGDKNGKGSSCKGCHFIKKDGLCGLPDVGIPEVAIGGCNPINWDDGKNRIWVKVE
jgi:hypothetical protein